MANCKFHKGKFANDGVCPKCKSCKHENFYQTERGFKSGICECNSCGKRFNVEDSQVVGKEIWVLWGHDPAKWITPKEAQKKLDEETEGKCLYCGKDLSDKKKGSKYCDDAHRMSFQREGTRTNLGTKPEQGGDYYKSEKYLQLMKDLESKTVEELEQQGYYVPNWKRQGYKSKSELISKLKIGTADNLDF